MLVAGRIVYASLTPRAIMLIVEVEAPEGTPYAVALTVPFRSVSLRQLAADLGVTERTIRDDVGEIVGRSLSLWREERSNGTMTHTLVRPFPR